MGGVVQTMWNGITVHSIAKNEEQWIWYSLMSVIDQVDEIIFYDTGSTDNTVEIVKSIGSPKIKIRECGEVSKEQFSDLKNEMLKETKTNWFVVIDGDEIWNYSMFKKVLERIQEAPENKVGALVHYLEFVKDIGHYFMGYDQQIYPHNTKRTYGWLSTRFIKNHSDLSCSNDYGAEGWWVDGHEIQRSGYENLIWNHDVYYFHARNLVRSSSNSKDMEVMLRVQKRHNHKIGQLPKHYRESEVKYPEVFFLDKPSIVPSVPMIEQYTR